MFSKKLSRSAVSVLGVVFAASIIIGLFSSMAMAEDDGWDQCGNNSEFTTEFRLEDCKFQDEGINPYFILKPGYRLVLETPEGEDEREKSVETVLCDTKWINLDGRWIKTRVVEERAYELETDEESGEVEEKLIEISQNYFAICQKTNAVYYFGEFSQACENGFTDDEQMCEGDEGEDPTEPVTEGSWEAGKPPMNDPDGVIARPGLIMPGTPLLGAKYFQEIAPPDAVDRGEIVALGLTWPSEDDLDEGEEPDFTGCINIIDTNPAEDACGDDDSKIYCPEVGIVQDEDLELVSYGFVGCDDNDDGHDYNRWKWSWRKSHWR